MGGDHRRAVVTGAASGIGYAVARRLLADGIDVLGADLKPEGLAELADAGAETVQVDITDPADRLRLVEAAGEPDYLVNAAGILHILPVDQVDVERWRSLFAVNVEALFFVSRDLGPRLRSGGAIVNIASIAARTSEPYFAAYCASKAAVLSLTRTFAFELAGQQVRVNSVSPGIIDTPMQNIFVPVLAEAEGKSPDDYQKERAELVPLGRIGSPEEVAAVVCFLLSQEASYVTGEDVNISAGLVT